MDKTDKCHAAKDDPTFQKVVRYFLDHPKPKDEGEDKPAKREPVKASKRAPRKRQP